MTVRLTPNVHKWTKILSRTLTKKEKHLIENTKAEQHMNKKIKELIKKVSDNIYIPRLSVTDGNCMYDSICYHLETINAIELRKLTANFMRIYKNYKKLFHMIDLSLYEMFSIQNEIKYVLDKKTGITYKYSYDIMCSDLECDSSWHRLPTEIILLCISYIFDAQINIYHNNGHVTQLMSTNKINKVIYLGLIDETHYIPLDKQKNIDKCDNILLYNNYSDDYIEWRNNQLKDNQLKDN